MLTALSAALALLAAAGPDGAPDRPLDRYVLSLSVVHEGVETVSARTILVEDRSANVTVQDDEGLFEMNASLTPVQGDGDGDLVLQVNITDGDAQPQDPSLIVSRGGAVRIVIGHEGPDGEMFEGLTITLTPAAVED